MPKPVLSRPPRASTGEPPSVTLVGTAGGMLRSFTPVEDYREQFSLLVKREDLACPPPGPPFSKTRGVYAWVSKRKEKIIGVLDTRHSQAGWAVARACQILGKQCINYYPEYKYDKQMREPQLKAQSLGATLRPLAAWRSAILFHRAKKDCESYGGVMIPNALKLHESVEETAKEVPSDIRPDYVLVPISSGTIAAGVIKGFAAKQCSPIYIIHLGYSRSHDEVESYLKKSSGIERNLRIRLVDENYQYKDSARGGPTPPWPCNPWYDLKCFRWWMRHRNEFEGTTLMWNIG